MSKQERGKRERYENEILLQLEAPNEEPLCLPKLDNLPLELEFDLFIIAIADSTVM